MNMNVLAPYREAKFQKMAALDAEQDQVSGVIDAAIAALDVWPQGKTITIYYWQWCQGAGYDSELEATSFDYDHGYSASDRLDDGGYVDIAARGRVRLIPEIHRPVVREITLSSMDDLERLYDPGMIRRLPVKICGAVSHWVDDGEMYWIWGNEDEGGPIERSINVPAPWLRSLLGIPDSWSITVQRPE